MQTISLAVCSNIPTFVFMCYALRFCAMQFVTLYSFMASLMLSSHLFVDLPLLLFPCTCMFNIFLVVSSPSFLNTWPYHRRRFFLRNVVIGSKLDSLRMSSFLMWSFSVLPLANLSILISVVFISFRDFPAFRPVYHCWLDYGFVDPIFQLDRHLRIARDSCHFSTCSRLHHVVHIGF